jgi:hypothetical protein
MTLGIVVYSLFIFKFYHYLAKRDILVNHWNRNYDWHEGPAQKFFKTIFYLIDYIILIPIVTFFWFIIMATLLIFLSNNSPSQILLLSMAIVGAIRITSYYTDELSKDLAKMIPFTLLGVFIIDLHAFSTDKFITNVETMFHMSSTLLYYLLFVVAIEFIMRLSTIIRHGIKKKFDPDYVSEETIYRKELKRINEENKKAEEKRMKESKASKKEEKSEDKKSGRKDEKKDDDKARLDIGDLEN